MKKRIAYFTPDCFIDSALPILSGLSRSFEVEWVVLYTYKSDFYKYSPDEIRAFAKRNNINLSIYKRKHRLRNLWNIPLLMSMFVYIRKVKPQLIYFTAEDDLYFSVLASLFFPVAKTVKGVHNVILHEKYDTFLKKLSHALLRKRFIYFQFYSRLQAEVFKKKYHLADYLMARLCLPQKETAQVYRDREKHVTHFIFFGKITYYKGVDILIKAVNRLSETNANFKVTIAGRCEDWENYDALIEAHENIELNIQMVPNSKLKEYLTQCHFVMLPYRSITQSGVITEYYNSYVPAIASDLEGLREYVTDGVNGLTFKSEDIDSLCRTMENAIQMSDEAYNAIRRNVKMFAETELDQAVIAEKYTTFFNSVIGRSSHLN